MARLPRGRRVRAALFVLTVLVVVVASTLGPGVVDHDGAATRAYQVGELVPQRAPAQGDVTIQPRDAGGVVLIDISHGNRMSQVEMKPLLTAISAAGYSVDLLERGESLDRSLSRADAFVVVDPSDGYDDDEVTRVEAFVERDGRLLLVGEPTTTELSGLALVERPNRLTPLSTPFGIEFGEAYLYNMAENDGNHLNVFVEPGDGGALTRGVSRAAFYTATSIEVREGQALLVAGEGTRTSRTDATGTFVVAARTGNVLALADGTFLQRGNFNVVDNEQLVRNVVRFLVSGERERTLAAYPAFVGEEPSIRFTKPALVDAAQQLTVDLRAAGADPSLRLQRSAVSTERTDVLVTTYGYLERHGQLGTGIRVNDGHVAVQGYDSSGTGIIVVRAPANGYDLVIAADTPSRAERAVSMLADGSLDEHLIARRTAVVRTSGVVATDSG